MKKRNLFLILLAALLVLFITAFVVVYQLVLVDGEDPSDPTSSPSEEQTEGDAHVSDHPILLTNISEVSLKAFTMYAQNGDETVKYRYIKDENGKYYAEDMPEHPLDQEIIASMAVAFTQLTSTYTVERSNGSTAYGFYTSDTPTYTIEDEIGNSIDIWIGKKCDLDDRYYAASSYEYGIYLVDFDKELLSYDHPYTLSYLDSFDFFEEDQMQSLVLKNGKGEILFEAPSADGNPLDIWSFLGCMDISPSAVQSGDPSAQQLEKWCLDSENVLISQVEFIDSFGNLKKTQCRLGAISEDAVSKQKAVYVQLAQSVYQTYITAEAASVLTLLRGN